MPHFPNLDPEVGARLEARGIDPERSCEAWLAAIRAGDFPLGSDGLPRRRPRSRPWARLGLAPPQPLTPIPLAVVLPDNT